MESVRQNKRRPRNKREVLTWGGRGEYVVAENEFNDLVRILMTPKNSTAMKKIMLSLFTNRELADIVRRIMIAKYITNGMSYEQIIKKAQTSKMTISLVNKILRWNPDLVHMLNPKIKAMPDIEKQIINRLQKGK